MEPIELIDPIDDVRDRGGGGGIAAGLSQIFASRLDSKCTDLLLAFPFLLLTWGE